MIKKNTKNIFKFLLFFNLEILNFLFRLFLFKLCNKLSI